MPNSRLCNKKLTVVKNRMEHVLNIFCKDVQRQLGLKCNVYRPTISG